ncbi:MAG TPA: hypothetical protein VD699_03525 [Nitrosopumilaceae archaeon]|nr:hypothetical protein [Nitrosopumilaceae archaeon]HXV38621.1 hypothetical protein [Nitrosopumilaceae archaeon]
MPLNLSEANKVFRKSIIKGYFETRLLNLDFKKSNIKHPSIQDDGLMQTNLLHLFFDIDTGSDYPDGDEWFMAEFIFPYSIKIPDSIKGPDYFSTISVGDGKNFWRHRELIRYKYGKSKKLEESLDFIEKKYKELNSLLEPLQKDLK